MSNKLKIILAVITIVLIITGSAIIFNSQRRNSQTPVSKIEPSSSRSTVSSSSSSQVSSVSISSASVESSSVLGSTPSSEVAKIDIPIASQVINSQTPMVEKPKSVAPVQPIVNPVVVPKVQPPKPICPVKKEGNIEIILTDNGCYGLSRSLRTIVSQFKFVGSYDQINNVILPMSKDYYSRIRPSLITKSPIISTNFITHISNTQAEITISTYDEEYLIKQYGKIPIGDNVNYKEATYTLNKANGTWTYSFKQFN